jgi:stearoyl-CoA desaturase (delta-9 desaturase)
VWWCWLFLPFTLANGAIQGAIVNWCGHMWGYRNFNLKDNSKNTWVLSTVMLGELYQNNHHQDQDNPNFGVKWFELDPTYFIIYIFDKVGIVKIKTNK